MIGRVISEACCQTGGSHITALDFIPICTEILTLQDTSATRFLAFGSTKGTSSPSMIIFPKIVPCSLIFLVSSLVSIPKG